MKALVVREGKHAARAIEGLRQVAHARASLAPDLRAIAEAYLGDRRGVVKKGARALHKAAGA